MLAPQGKARAVGRVGREADVRVAVVDRCELAVGVELRPERELRNRVQPSERVHAERAKQVADVGAAEREPAALAVHLAIDLQDALGEGVADQIVGAADDQRVASDGDGR